MKRLILFLGLFFVGGIANADYYDLQQYTIVPDTINVSNDFYYRGNFHVVSDTYTVRLASCTSNVIFFATGTVKCNRLEALAVVYASTETAFTNAVTFASSATVNSDLIIQPTKKLFLDSGVDTYITQQTANNMYFYTGGQVGFYINSNQVCGAASDFRVEAGKKIFLDGGDNSFITQYTNDVITILTAGATSVFFSGKNTYIPATGVLYLDGGGDTYVSEYTSNNVLWYAAGKPSLQLAGDLTGKTTVWTNGTFILGETNKAFLDGGSDTYIYDAGGNDIYFVSGNTNNFEMSASNNYSYKNLIPVGAGLLNTGDAGNYWGDVSYKTLTDRGCLGWFDEGVELQDGKKVSDTEALLAIQKHPTKKTVYGTEMLDYRTFPKCAYKPADKDIFDEEGKKIGKVPVARDANDEPIDYDKDGNITRPQDGIEMTSMFSIMIGATKELTLRVKQLEADNADLKKRIEALEKK